MLHLFKSSNFKSPNFGERRNGQKPSMIIMHYTGLKDADQALTWLCEPSREVSAHYVIEENGKVHHLVEDGKRAWHAGVSYWAGEEDINSLSIGIELVNPGHEFGYRDFPDRQIRALTRICSELILDYDIKANHILGHSDIAPGRKQDPGHLFPWERLAHKGVGLWPQPNEYDYQSAEDLVLNLDKVHGLLVDFGYNPDTAREDLFVAYHRHFYPEKFKENGRPDQVDIASVARLLSLLRQKSEL